MVNLEGFNEFVDAMGGVTIDVTQRLPIGGLPPTAPGCLRSATSSPGVST